MGIELMECARLHSRLTKEACITQQCRHMAEVPKGPCADCAQGRDVAWELRVVPKPLQSKHVVARENGRRLGHRNGTKRGQSPWTSNWAGR